MKRKRHSPEQIIQKLREAEILLQKGQDVPRVCRAIGVTPEARKNKPRFRLEVR